MKKLSVFTALAIVAISGCATDYIKPSGLTNPPPSSKFSEYQSFEMKELSIAPKYASQPANQKAGRKIQQVLHQRMDGMLNTWNDLSGAGGSGRTLVIEPEVTDIKFVGGASRFWGGAFAGSSAVKMKVAYRDKSSGEVVAEPEFYQHANAWAGAYSFGGADNAMLTRIAELASDYTAANYDEAVGGPTGAPPP